MFTLIDAHCDTFAEIADKNQTFEKNDCMINLEMTKHFDAYIQFYAAYASKKYLNPTLRAIEILDKAKSEIKSNNINLITDYRTLEKTIKKKKHGAILAIEDARALGASLSALRFFYDYGVRAITLAWNDDNELTDGADSAKKSGLTPFGKDVVAEMNRLGMMIDVSHISEKGFYDVLAASKYPVIASHSNCYSLCAHKRNLKDEQIKALISCGGIICINIYPAFLESNPDDATIDSIIRHIDYALSLGCENNLGLGSDFDGIDKTPEGIANLADYEKLFNKMLKSGYTEKLLNKITHKNICAFIKKVMI